MSEQAGNLVRRVKQDLIANKKKTAILGVLLVALLVALLRLAGSDATPSEAAAEPAAPVAATTPKDPVVPTVRPMPQSAAPPATKGAPMLKEEAGTTHVSQTERKPALAAKRQAKAVPVDDMSRTQTRNIFETPSWSVFPPDIDLRSKDSTDADGAKSSPSWLTQVGAMLAERQAQRAQQVAAINEALSQLELQSTMTGGKPLAYVSGRLVREGDTIRGFSVVRIEDKRVVLRKDTFKRELTMP
ncbi:MAG: hypothetical protein ABII12_02350 [Planctomycetota bacterium]